MNATSTNAEQPTASSPNPTSASAQQPTASSAEPLILSDYGLETVAVLTAIIFFTGWQYAQSYYGVFGVGLVSQLDLDVTYYLVWAYTPLIEYVWWIVCAVVIVVVIHSLGLRLLPNWRGYVSRSLILIALIIFWAFSTLAKDVGKKHGRRDLDAGSTMLPIVKITLRDSELTKKIGWLPTHPLGINRYLLLGHHRSTYILVQTTNSGGLQESGPRIVIVPDEIVATVEIISLEE